MTFEIESSGQKQGQKDDHALSVSPHVRHSQHEPLLPEIETFLRMAELSYDIVEVNDPRSARSKAALYPGW